MSTTPKRHPHPKPEIEQSILDSKAALATSPDKDAEQQKYPTAIAHDTAQESLDNDTKLSEKQTAELKDLKPPTEESKPEKDDSPAAQQIIDTTQASVDLEQKKGDKAALAGTPPTILKNEDIVEGATKVDFGKAGSVDILSFSTRQYGVNGAEYSVTVDLGNNQTVVLHSIPARLLK